MTETGEISVATDPSAQLPPEWRLDVDVKTKLGCSSLGYIHRVPKNLRVDGEDIYKYRPCIVSIGPYHRHQQGMHVNDNHKKLYLHSLLSRFRATLGVFYEMIHANPEVQLAARNCYAESLELPHEEFLEMLVLDGCFILELLFKYHDENDDLAEDVLFNQNWVVPYIRRDLVLLENQIPFIVLEFLLTLLAQHFIQVTRHVDITTSTDQRRLPSIHFTSKRNQPLRIIHKFSTSAQQSLMKFIRGNSESELQDASKTTPSIDPALMLSELVHYFFSPILPCTILKYKGYQGRHPKSDLEEPKKGIFQKCWGCGASCISKFWSTVLPTLHPPESISEGDHNIRGEHILDYLRKQQLIHEKSLLQSNRVVSRDNVGDRILWGHTTCATDLQEAGVKFKRKEPCLSLLDITFDQGVLEIPPFYFGVSWTVLIPNMIALEQCRGDYGDEITSYGILMDNLINSHNDVKILRGKGIIDGSSKEDKEIAHVVNNLSKEAIVNHFYYDDLCRRVNAYRQGTIATWRADFMRKFIHTPWAGISVLAAVFLLLLTVAQTVFSIMSWKVSLKG